MEDQETSAKQGDQGAEIRKLLERCRKMEGELASLKQRVEELVRQVEVKSTKRTQE